MGDDIMGVDTNNAVTWNNLNEKELIFGKSFGDGTYTLRVPSTGTDIRITGNVSVFTPDNSEFEAFHKIEAVKKALIEEKQKYGWGQDSSGTNGSLRSNWTYQNSDPVSVGTAPDMTGDDAAYIDKTGYRPVLEPTAGTELTVVELNLDGGAIGNPSSSGGGTQTEGTETVKIVVSPTAGTGNSKTYPAPTSEGLTAPTGKPNSRVGKRLEIPLKAQ